MGVCWGKKQRTGQTTGKKYEGEEEEEGQKARSREEFPGVSTTTSLLTQSITQSLTLNIARSYYHQYLVSRYLSYVHSTLPPRRKTETVCVQRVSLQDPDGRGPGRLGEHRSLDYMLLTVAVGDNQCVVSGCVAASWLHSNCFICGGG